MTTVHATTSTQMTTAHLKKTGDYNLWNWLEFGTIIDKLTLISAYCWIKIIII
jgi:hypothetical protein